jgi:hypothetical protein
MAAQGPLVPAEQIEQAIQFVRGHKVMLDSDLAKLYGVDTKILNKAVKRNIDRFPLDFMFQLTADEVTSLRFQIGTLNAGRGRHRKYLPYAFTEQGVAMLSSVLRSPQAVRVNIEIMRAFVRLRQLLAGNAELAHRLAELERHVRDHDQQFVSVIRAIRELMARPRPPRSGGLASTRPSIPKRPKRQRANERVGDVCWRSCAAKWGESWRVVAKPTAPKMATRAGLTS